MATMRVFTLTPVGEGNVASEALIIFPSDDGWNVPAVLDKLAEMDILYEPRGFSDVRAEEM